MVLRLTPLDIKKQEFKRSMRGYDPEEVNAFLEMVAEEFEALHREKNRLED
jgi:DivIVA domain-containing protein